MLSHRRDFSLTEPGQVWNYCESTKCSICDCTGGNCTATTKRSLAPNFHFVA